MTLTETIGYAAAVLTTGSFLPQAWHTFKTRDVGGISLGMYSVFIAGSALWLSYGLLIVAWPIVIANAVTLALTIAILLMKLRFHGPAASRRV
ncbi:MAG: SemiSWEET transporter [Rhodoferax sp.]|nr:SemiSWEET transporter [Rhodoferax sp.]